MSADLDPNRVRDVQRLLAAHACAAAIYVRQLRYSRAFLQRDYLTRRGLDGIWHSDKWLVGYARPGWTDLTKQLRDAGFSDHDLIASGLSLQCRDGRLIDRFRDRIMIGIRDLNHDAIAFVGRAAPGAPNSIPRYLNSPNTPLYKKSAIVFGLAEHAAELRAGSVPVLVEGPIDVMALDTRTGSTAVCTCGTAVTRQHAESIRAASRTGRLIACFDADGAGNRAQAAAYGPLREQFSQVLAVDLPASLDPADVVSGVGGRQAWRELTAAPHPLADTIIDRAIEPWIPRLDNVDVQVIALKSAAAAIARLPIDEAARQVDRIHERLGFRHEVVTAELASAVSKGARGPVPTSATQPTREVSNAASSRLICT